VSAHSEPADRSLMDGRALLEMGRAADAVVALTRAVAENPQSSVAYANLALAELRLTHYAKARDAAQHALALDAESEWAHRILAIALMRLGKHQEARAEALRAVSLVPEGHQGYVVLAQALLGTGDLAGALESANHAVRLAPESPEAHSTVAQVRLRREEWSAAEAAARRALRVDAENPIALNNLAVALRRQRRQAESVQAYEQAVRIAPDNPTIRRNVFRLRHTSAIKHLSEPTRTLIADDTRARRYQPHRWDWGRAKRFRPWWWVLLSRIRAPEAFAMNAMLFAVLLAVSLGSRTSGPWVWVAVLGLALPFSTRRAWRWWQIRHPPASSWKPTGADEPSEVRGPQPADGAREGTSAPPTA